jgi:hypothetical protein
MLDRVCRSCRLCQQTSCCRPVVNTLIKPCTEVDLVLLALAEDRIYAEISISTNKAHLPLKMFRDANKLCELLVFYIKRDFCSL